MNNQYKCLARVYDALMYDVPYAKWAEYIIDLFKDSQIVKGSSVLEYACGTGNITVELARKGYRMTALDLSEEMLRCAAEKLRKNALSVNLVSADMVDFYMGRTVDAAVCACDGVNYILRTEKLERFFFRVYSLLNAGGFFTFDVSSEYKISQILSDEFFYDDAEEQTLFWKNRYDAIKRQIDMDITVFIAGEEGYQRFDECHTQRAWREEEIRNALEKVGFCEIKNYAFGTKIAPEANCERIQFTAIK